MHTPSDFSAEDVLRVVDEVFTAWDQSCIQRQNYRPTLQGVIVPAIAELLLNPWTHDHFEVVWIDPEIAPVKERVQITSEQNAIRDLVVTIMGVGTDMGRLQNRKRFFARDGAASLISIGNQNAE